VAFRTSVTLAVGQRATRGVFAVTLSSSSFFVRFVGFVFLRGKSRQPGSVTAFAPFASSRPSRRKPWPVQRDRERRR
jgi:hypothetical protein